MRSATVLVYLALPFLVWGLVWLYRRKRKIVEAIHVQPRRAFLIRNALSDWLQDKTVCRSMIDTGTATVGQLQATLLILPALDEEKLLATCKDLLRDRNVRRVIAAYMRKRYGADVAQVLVCLRKWAGPVEIREGVA